MPDVRSLAPTASSSLRADLLADTVTHAAPASPVVLTDEVGVIHDEMSLSELATTGQIRDISSGQSIGQSALEQAVLSGLAYGYAVRQGKMSGDEALRQVGIDTAKAATSSTVGVIVYDALSVPTEGHRGAQVLVNMARWSTSSATRALLDTHGKSMTGAERTGIVVERIVSSIAANSLDRLARHHVGAHMASVAVKPWVGTAATVLGGVVAKVSTHALLGATGTKQWMRTQVAEALE